MVYRLNQVTKTYQDKPVLELDQLHIEQGRIHALVGPNGAGKTTLLNILAFLERPTTGIIHYGSRLVEFSQSFLQQVRKDVIMVHQNPILFSTSVYKNLELGLKIRKISKLQRKDLIRCALQSVGMQHKIDAAAHTLSGGEAQRVALARALVLSPKVLLCDEPTAYVDLEYRNIIMELLQNANSQDKITVVFATHDKLQAAWLAHNIIMLERGKLTDTSYDNFFTASFTPDRDGRVFCRIQDALELKIATDKTGTRRIFIDPEKIQLVSSPVTQPGTTRLQGEVSQVTGEKGKIRIQVQSAIPIALLVSKEQYQQQRPLVGQQIAFDLMPNAIRIY